MARLMNESLTTPDQQLVRAKPVATVSNPNAPSAIMALTTAPVQQQIIPAIAEPPPKQNKNVIPLQPNFDDVPNFDIMQLLSDLDNDPENVVKAVIPVDTGAQPVAVPSTQNTSNISNVMQRNSPMFHSCKIGQININITKK